MSESRWRVGLFGLVLALLCLAARPAYASVADGHISTGENLLELVSKTNASDTRGKTYTLDADVSIDTSTLATSFSRYSPSRTFAGTLDGAGHTITVVAPADDKLSQPLFDLVQGQSGPSAGRAQIKNLTLTFKGSAQGATLAGGITNTLIDGVGVNFENVEPASIGGQALSTGFVGYFFAGENSFDTSRAFTKITGVSLNGGNIGLLDARGESTVYSGSLGSFVGVGNVLIENTRVNVGNVFAVATSGSACAAGAVTGDPWGQCQLALNGVTAHASSLVSKSSGNSDVYALGLATSPIAMTDCHVIVDGDISIESGSSNSRSDAVASGLCFRPYCTRNAELGYSAVSNTSVKVVGNISATSRGGASAGAYGLAYLFEVDAGWSGIEVEAKNIEAMSASGEAYAAGGAFLQTIQNQSNVGLATLDDISVVTDQILASSTQNSAYAQGLFDLASYPCNNCSVKAGAISANADGEAEAAGFVNTYMPDPYTDLAVTGPIANRCKVSVGTISASGKSGDRIQNKVGGFAFDVAGNRSYTVQNCSVTITDGLDALVDSESVPKNVGLFSATNSSGTKLFNNTVTLPQSQANVVVLNGDDAGSYVRFTADEADGRAASTDWQRGNQVLFSDARGGGDVTCAFDSSSDHGTLWRLPDPQFGGLTISCDATGEGAQASDEFTFTLTLDDATVSGTYGDLQFVDGVATFTLKAGQSVTALKLPEGVGYKVSVVAPEGYTVASSEGTEGTVEKDETAVVRFTFNKEKQPDPKPVTPKPTTPDDGNGGNGGSGNGGAANGGGASGSKPTTDEQLPQTGDVTSAAPLALVGVAVVMAGIAVARKGR